MQTLKMFRLWWALLLASWFNIAQRYLRLKSSSDLTLKRNSFLLLFRKISCAKSKITLKLSLTSYCIFWSLSRHEHRIWTSNFLVQNLDTSPLLLGIKKFDIRRNSKKVDSIKTGCIVIPDLLSWSNLEKCIYTTLF